MEPIIFFCFVDKVNQEHMSVNSLKGATPSPFFWCTQHNFFFTSTDLKRYFIYVKGLTCIKSLFFKFFFMYTHIHIYVCLYTYLHIISEILCIPKSLRSRLALAGVLKLDHRLLWHRSKLTLQVPSLPLQSCRVYTPVPATLPVLGHIHSDPGQTPLDSAAADPNLVDRY